MYCIVSRVPNLGSVERPYVDDQLVAIDGAPQNNFPSVTEGLCLGADNTSAPGTFWAGMMDEVRVYEQVVAP
jgi:hypothetical protein